MHNIFLYELNDFKSFINTKPLWKHVFSNTNSCFCKYFSANKFKLLYFKARNFRGILISWDFFGTNFKFRGILISRFDENTIIRDILITR